jgi:hypothetical protein
MSQPPKPPSRFANFLELEDLLLAFWLLAAETLVVRWSGRKPVEWAEPGQDGLPWPLLLLLAAAAFVIFTRGSCDTTIDTAVKRRILMVLPLYFLLPLIAMLVSAIRGGEKSVRHLGGDEAEWPMPAAPDWLRRLVATPILLVGDSAFLSAFEKEQQVFLGLGDFTATAVISACFLVALPYLIFVIGPRVAAGSSADWKAWLPRFAFYAVVLVAGWRLESLGIWRP